MQALAGSAQSASEVVQCRCAFMHVLNVKRQCIDEIIFQKGNHLIAGAVNRGQKKQNSHLRKGPL